MHHGHLLVNHSCNNPPGACVDCTNGIMNSFPTLDGNQISSDEQQQEQQQQQQQDSDPYIGVAYGSTYWNKGGVRLLPQYLHLASSTGHSNMSQHIMEG